MCVCLCVSCHRGQERTSNPLELGVQEALGHAKWMFQTVGPQQLVLIAEPCFQLIDHSLSTYLLMAITSDSVN